MGCFTVYNREIVAKENLPGVKKETVLLCRGGEKFRLADVSVVNGRLEATAYAAPSRFKPKQNEVLYIYASPAAEIPASLPAQVSIPLAAIYEAEVYDINAGKTAQRRSAAIPGLVVGISVPLVFLIILIFGS
jgi:hypothetical protein